MNIALNDPADRVAKIALQDFKPDEIIVIYHDAGALAVNAAARISLKAATAILAAGQP
jgi:hypothetical protein